MNKTSFKKNMPKDNVKLASEQLYQVVYKAEIN